MQSSSIEPSLATFACEPARLHSFSNLATPGSNESTLYTAPFPLCCMSYTFLVLRQKSTCTVGGWRCIRYTCKLKSKLRGSLEDFMKRRTKISGYTVADFFVFILFSFPAVYGQSFYWTTKITKF